MKYILLLTILISAPIFANHNPNEPPEGYYGLDQPRDPYESSADYDRIQQERQRQDNDWREEQARRQGESSFNDPGNSSSY